MAFWNKLFENKKKKGDEDDGQEQYFKEEYRTVAKKEPEKVEKTTAKAEPKTVAKAVSEEKKQAKSQPAKATHPAEKTATKSASAKATTPATKTTPNKKEASASKASETKAQSTAKATTAKTTKNSEKPVKATTKPASKEVELRDDSPEVTGAVSVKESKETANGKFDIRRAKDGRFFFSLYASNHAVIAYSQIYSSITAVNTGIASVINNAEKAEIEDTTLKKTVSLPCPKWEIYIDKAEQYRFRLYATNGLVVCHSSHGYASKSGCKGGIDSIRRFAADATVDKSYLK